MAAQPEFFQRMSGYLGAFLGGKVTEINLIDRLLFVLSPFGRVAKCNY